MVPVLAARRPAHTLALKNGIAAGPPLAPVAHATRSDLFDVLRSGTSRGTRHSIDTRMVATGEGRVVRLRVGLAAGPTDDTTLSEPFIKSLAEFQTFFSLIFWSRCPALRFLRDEIRDLSRTTRNTFHRLTTDFMSQAALHSI